MKTRPRNVALALALALALAVALLGCSEEGTDRAGGSSNQDPVELRFAQPNGEPPQQLLDWATEVERLTDGEVIIVFEDDWRFGQAHYERGTLQDVMDGKVDLAWVGARAFDGVGVTSFQPLLAPLLVDSYELQAAIFERGIADDMLRGLDEAALTGVGILPGPMRKVLGVDKPFTRPSDFAGQRVGLQASAIGTDALAAFGAKTEDLPSAADLSGVDAYEQQLASIAGNRYVEDGAGKYVTANLNLWPRPLVIVANPGVEDRVGDDNWQAVRQAAAAAQDDALDSSREEDEKGLPSVCQATVVQATDDDLAALREAAQPIYDQLAAGEETQDTMAAMLALKEQVGAPPATVRCPDDEDASTGDFPEGTFASPRTGKEFETECGWEDVAMGDVEVSFEDGRLEQSNVAADGSRVLGFSGTYEVFRDRLTITDPVGSLTARWTFESGKLTLSDVQGACDDVAVWTGEYHEVVAPD